MELCKMSNKKIQKIADQTVPRQAWIWLLVFTSISFAILIWSIFGTVDINIEGKGVILSQQGLVTIQTPVKGIVTSLHVKPGDHVNQGDFIAEVADIQKEILLKTTQMRVETLRSEYERLSLEVNREREASKQYLERHLAALQFEINLLNERGQFLETEYDKKIKLYQDGLIILNIVQDTERQISDAKVSLEEKKGEMADLHSKLNQSYRSEELKAKEFELLKAEEELHLAQLSLNQNRIYSPFTGRILEMFINSGENVVEGVPLFHLEQISSDKKILFYGFFPHELGKHIRKGTVMRMKPFFINANEYGAVLSRVKEVSEYAISEKAILNELHNAELVHLLTNQQPVTQVIAEPIEDLSDPNRVAWTSRKGPPMELSTGIIGKVEVSIERIHPIYYLFPLQGLKKTSLAEGEFDL